MIGYSAGSAYHVLSRGIENPSGKHHSFMDIIDRWIPARRRDIHNDAERLRGSAGWKSGLLSRVEGADATSTAVY